MDEKNEKVCMKFYIMQYQNEDKLLKRLRDFKIRKSYFG